MKILKMGHPHEIRKVCRNCECEFLYNINEDVEVKYIKGLFDSCETEKWVTCPCCNYRIYL